jgi:prepilin-type N-terminal cleavage/methylation domain-containing protein
MRGFTLIEVLVALLIFMVAMLGLVALQRASVSGANMGREHTAAVDLARYVMTWLENEAAAWPLADTTPGPPAFADLPLLNRGLGEPDTWHTLSSADVRFDAYLEHSAEQLYSEVDSAQFCVHYRIAPVGSTDDPVAYRAWVRVTWPKWGQYASGTWNQCEARISDVPSDIGKYQVVELTGVVTREYTGRWTADS